MDDMGDGMCVVAVRGAVWLGAKAIPHSISQTKSCEEFYFGLELSVYE
jgi:hypothetical protein